MVERQTLKKKKSQINMSFQSVISIAKEKIRDV